MNFWGSKIVFSDKPTISIIDITGQVVFSEGVSLNEGSTVVTKNLSSLRTGTYLTRVQFENGSSIVKPIVVYKR